MGPSMPFLSAPVNGRRFQKCWAVFTFFLFIAFELISSASSQEEGPTLSVGSTSTVEFIEGENALLMCVIHNLGPNTVIWSKVVQGKKKIYTIDTLVVIHDERVSVLHNKGSNSSVIQRGDVWVLSIKDVKESDAGGYICRVNSSPPAQTFYTLTVKPKTVVDNTSLELKSHHNYTACCVKNLVSANCLGFCAIHNILEGTTGIAPEECEGQFPKIVRCMADSRNHVPCCERQGIPDICQDLCRGEYTIQDDYVQTHFSCTTYTEATLMCISEGIEILPEHPSEIVVEVLGPDRLAVNWSEPRSSSPTIDNYFVNITRLKEFVRPEGNTSEILPLDTRDDFRLVPANEKSRHVVVSSNATSVVVNGLSPLSWYEISVTASNQHGSSLSTYKLRSLTPAEDHKPKTKTVRPNLPDVVGCCISKGVKHQRCIHNLCNPRKRFIEEPDLIVCAAWTQEAFSCLANGVDHSDCCKERGLPDLCVQLCTGNVTQIDYTYFKCVDYFSDYRSCLMKGYGVIPSPPLNVRVSNIHSNFALLTWDPPVENADSVTSYHAYFKPLNATPECTDKFSLSNSGAIFHGAYVPSPPYVVEHLCENTEFELFVQAFNIHGISDPSPRIVFSTKQAPAPVTSYSPYNVSECCRLNNLSPACMSLCTHNPRMGHVTNLATTCRAEMPALLKCVVGGRDHMDCCKRRGVPENCLMQCRGAILTDDGSTGACLPYYGNVMMCLEEGMGILPGPVTALHATGLSNNSVTLQWEPPIDSAKEEIYQIHYQEVDNTSAARFIYSLNQTMNVSKPVAVVSDLKTNFLYNFFVIAMNSWGASLPSSVLTINVTDAAERKIVAAVSSAPHSLVLEAKKATSLTVLWQPPALSLPTDRFRYEVNVAMISEQTEELVYNKTTTPATALMLDDLQPNTQYVFYVVAINDKGRSMPSETLLAWTDPAYPAFVETPTVHPINLVVEGRSMTVLCIAMGSPPPKVSLYISGKLFHEDVTRHMVVVVKNVTRDMTDIACYADNGYGTPMQSSINIAISHRPSIVSDEIVRAITGTQVTLECQVESWPEPSLVWWKNPASREPVIHGGNVTLQTRNLTRGNYKMLMTLDYAMDAEYFCHASNALGAFTKKIKLETTTAVRMPLNISKCCERSNVSKDCLMACDFDQIDFHLIMGKDNCFPDFAKILQCGSDASDHRGCCAKSGVPSRCLEWCRGNFGNSGGISSCPLLWAAKIFECFGKGVGTLPGPPLNVQFESISATSAQITWDLPAKNPTEVELYRVFWREKGTQDAETNDTTARSLVIKGLKDGYDYEVAVKAGNHLGTSVLTPTKIFTHSHSYISSKETRGSNETGLAVGIVFSLIILVGLGAFAWWFFRRKQLMAKGNNGISFENPSYNRKQSGEAVQIAETPNGSLNGSTTPSLPSNGIPGIPNGGAFSDMNNGGGGVIWNTHDMGSNTPGFENDIDPKGGYKRMKS